MGMCLECLRRPVWLKTTNYLPWSCQAQNFILILVFTPYTNFLITKNHWNNLSEFTTKKYLNIKMFTDINSLTIFFLLYSISTWNRKNAYFNVFEGSRK